MGMQYTALFPHEPLFSLLPTRNGEFYSKMEKSDVSFVSCAFQSVSTHFPRRGEVRWGGEEG